MTDIHVVIPMKGRADLTLNLLKDLRREDIGTTIIFDNGSPPSQQIRIRESLKPHTEIQLPRAGLSIHEMWNEGLRLGQLWGGHVAILNNDIRLKRGTLRGMADVLDAHADVAVVSADHDKRTPGLDACACCGAIDVDQIAAGGGLAGFAFMIRNDWDFSFDEGLMWWYGDNDLVRTVLHEGKRVAVAAGAMVEHVDGGGQTGLWHTDPVRWMQIQADGKRFREKWEGVHSAS